MKYLTIPLIFIFCLPVFSQNAFHALKNISRAEKRWVVFHIQKSRPIHAISLSCQHYADSLKGIFPLDTKASGGTADAFRHAFWMAVLSQQFPERCCRRLGKAHEKGNKQQFRRRQNEDGILPDKASCEMDLMNNESGILIGKSHPSATWSELTDVILGEILAGKLFIIKQNESGQLYLRNGIYVDECDLPRLWDNGKVVCTCNVPIQ